MKSMNAVSDRLTMPTQKRQRRRSNHTPGRSYLKVKPRIAIRARGTRIFCQDGSEIIDACSGTFCLPLGYNHEAIEFAVQKQADAASYVPSDMMNTALEELRSRLMELSKELIPNPRVWLRDVCGTGANEGAIKIAQKATRRKTVIAFTHSHHGQSLAMTGVSGNPFRRACIPATRLDWVRHVPYADGYHSLETVREALSSVSNAACVIVEPVQGNGGNVVPPRWFFDLLRSYCDGTGALLIADEVQTGMGRLGTVFGCEALGLEPDIVTMAKGLASGYPLGAIVYPACYDVLEKHDHSFTSGAHPLSVAAAVATIEELLRPGLLDRVITNGEFFHLKLNALRDRHRGCIQRVQGLGHMWGIDMVDSEGLPSAALANEVALRALEQFDLRVRTSRYGRGNTVKIRPSLNASEEDLEEILVRLEKAIAATEYAHD